MRREIEDTAFGPRKIETSLRRLELIVIDWAMENEFDCGYISALLTRIAELKELVSLADSDILDKRAMQ